MAKIGNQELTQGWYMTAGIAVAIAFGNTPAAPILLGILVTALIYQLTALLEHVPPGGVVNPQGSANVPTIGPNTAGNTGSPSVTFV